MIFRIATIGVIAGAIALAAAVVVVGLFLSAPARAKVGAGPADLHTEEVTIASPSGAALRGWFIEGRPGGGAVVLMHGVKGNRLHMVPRARLLAAAGFSVLLFDFQAHGESTGDRITFGRLEGLDARAAVAFVRARLPTERVGAIGSSLGGAAALLGPGPLPVDALVLESIYSEIGTAIANRINATLPIVGGIVARPLAWLFEVLLPPIVGVRPDELRPIDHIAEVTAPVLVAAGTLDDRTTLAEADAIFARAPEPKWFWWVATSISKPMRRMITAAACRRFSPSDCGSSIEAWDFPASSHPAIPASNVRRKSMSDMRLIVAGAGGRMGRTLIHAIAAIDGATLVGAVDAPGSAVIGRDSGELAGLGKNGVQVAAEVEPLLANADGLLDFTIPAATVALAEIVARKGLVHVIGTTGLSGENEKLIAEAGKRAVIVKSGNMSMGVNLLAALVKRVAKTLDEDFDVEVLEMHHNKKIDAPSGTALMLGRAAAEGRGVDLDQRSERGRDGETGARARGDIGFASLRGGTVVGDHTVIFAGPAERIELSHKAEDRMIFARGAVRAALWARGQKPGVYSMADVLGLRDV